MAARAKKKSAEPRQRKPHSTSVTSIPCTCDWLSEVAKKPEVPIVFDELTNEYQLAYVDGEARGNYTFYHCPWCGGAAPKSLRESLFERITSAEQRRLEKLTAALTSIDDVIARFGEPDEDLPRGITIESKATAEIKSYRVLRYYGLSKVADVRFTDYRPEGELQVAFQGKFIGPKPRI